MLASARLLAGQADGRSYFLGNSGMAEILLTAGEMREADARAIRAGISGFALSAMQIYVGVLAATILFLATHAGVIGASRITYSMAMKRIVAARTPT